MDENDSDIQTSDENDSGSQASDPVVAFRRQKNRTGVRTRYMALNAEAIRIVRMMESMINIEADNVEGLTGLFILHMIDLVYDEEESLDSSSPSSSDEESMTDNNDSVMTDLFRTSCSIMSSLTHF